MDAQNGLLMAVKQVDVPTGLSSNEERKKDMLSALEREIELLKELQHENIVQYLGRSPALPSARCAPDADSLRRRLFDRCESPQHFP